MWERARNTATASTSAGCAGTTADRLSTVEYIGTSTYNALQASMRRRESNGLSYLLSYTFGDARNNTHGFFPGNPSRGGTVTDPSCVNPALRCNRGLDEGPADYDARHRFPGAATYELP